MEAPPEPNFRKAPTTTEEYLSLCTGTGRDRGHQQMYTKHITQCYRVAEERVKAVTLEAVEFLANDEELLRGVQSIGNSPSWKTTRAALFTWLAQDSQWNTDDLFGAGNTTVPDEVKRETMLRIAQDAREEIKINGVAYGIDPPTKQEPTNDEFFFTRSAATSPARSTTSIAASQMRYLDVSDAMPSIPDIRSSNISFVDAEGTLIKRVTMKKALHPNAFTDRTKMMTSMDVDYLQLRAATAIAATINEADLLLSFNGDKINSQHELEAAVNDFVNGIRQSNNFELVVTSARTDRGRKEFTRPRAPSTARGFASTNTLSHNLDIDMADVAAADKTSEDHLDKSRTGGGSSGGDKSGVGGSGGDLSASDRGGSDSSSVELAKGTSRKRETRMSTPGFWSKSRSATPEPDQPGVYGVLPNTDDSITPIDDVDGGDIDNDHESKLLEYMQARLNDSEAGFKAMRVTPDEWRSASDTFGVPMKRLREQHTSEDRFIPVDPALGFNPKLKLMAHQVVGADVIHDMNFGQKRGCVEQDHMGMGKTIQIICAYFINLVLTFEAHEVSTLPSNQRLRLGPDGLFKGRSPRVGATFLSAYSNGVEPWPRDWIKVVKDSPLLNQAPMEWRPKMIILHESGKTHCETYGGEANGLYFNITMDDLIQMLPRPDWDKKARAAYTFPSDLCDGEEGAKVKYTSNSTWSDHPRATTSVPSPTSVRYFIVSTNKCWQGRLYDVVQENFKAVIEIDTSIRKTKPAFTKQLRDLHEKRRMAIHRNLKGGGDGKQRNQATRTAIWKDNKGHNKTVTMVCDLLYAAWVIIDEIHSAGGENTLTYTGIIDPFNSLVEDPALRPAFTAITGSAMANGIVTVLVFALKGLRREDPAWKRLPDKAIQFLQKRDLKETLKTWKAFEKVSGKEVARPMAERIESNPRMKDILEVIAEIIGTYFIGRDYHSVDAWGRKLNLMNCTLKDQYLPIVYKPDYHDMLRDIEKNIIAQVKQQYDEALGDWHDLGGESSGKPKPKFQSAAFVDPGSYQKAKILASFPNFLNAVYKYQDENPDVRPLIGLETSWGEDLGKNNLELDEILKNPTKILGSIIYKAINGICKGSAKMEHILFKAKKTARERTTAPNPRKDLLDLPSVAYRSKYCIASNVRLCKAIVFARMVQEFGRPRMAWVGEGLDKDAEVLKWRKFFSIDNDQVEDNVQFMVAGLKMVCQSIDLVEGHVFEGLEPHSINAEAEQYGYRGFRIGQVADEVELNYLLHSGSYVEELTFQRNMIKNRFAAQCRATQLNMIKEMATAMGEDDDDVV